MFLKTCIIYKILLKVSVMIVIIQEYFKIKMTLIWSRIGHVIT